VKAGKTRIGKLWAMDQERWKRIESLFESALGQDEKERAAFLEHECGDDLSLRKEVESLLANQQPTGRFIPTLLQGAAKLMAKDNPMPEGTRFIPGTVLASRYRIVGLLGKGGMGEVYRADDLRLGQSVALKFLPEKLAQDKAMLERFHREVRVARQISHPNVCRVHDIGEAKGQSFLSMEYIDGEDLATLLRRIGRLPSDKAVEIASQLCGGLAAAHQEGVLHRDLKPANVMIDGRGRAKITDFGLAGLAEEFEGAEVRAGTPAYMAPEQLAGKEVSVKSDIYSLGLVLYELFTGKRVFVAATPDELMKLHESSSPPSISEHVKEVDPLVERVILRCLERHPQSRPNSVAQVAAALPGGDPLAAAIAAGETPSPEMVAAAPKEGALRSVAAVACLAAFFIGLATILLVASRITMHNVVPLEKSPEVLAERAGTILKRFAHTPPPADIDFGLNEDPGYTGYARQRGESMQGWQRLETGQPLHYYFWYRQSPRLLEAKDSTVVSLTDPPLEFSGMANVILDTRGRLVELYAVPKQVEALQQANLEPDWTALFAEAGLNIAAFTPVASEWLPPVYADTRAAWQGAYADHPDIPIRIEAAAQHGEVVYFQVVAPWDEPVRQVDLSPTPRRLAAGFILATLFFIALIAGVLLARHNLRLGRGDRKGSFKLATFIFLVTLVGEAIGADHVPTLGGELIVMYKAVGWSLFASVFLWILYMALEPSVRRRWPKLIISWSRLLAGDFRDPMVGRDVLIGSLLGFAHTLAIYSMTFFTGGMSKTGFPAIGIEPVSLLGTRTVLSTLLGTSVVLWLLIGLGFLFLLLLFYVLFRRQWLAATVLWLLIVTVELLAFTQSLALSVVMGPLVIATVLVVAVVRFGLLTTIACQFFFDLSFHYALTPDLSAWHAHTTFIIIPLFIAVAVYSFYISLGGQTLFSADLLRE
jgi:hypothetical protein